MLGMLLKIGGANSDSRALVNASHTTEAVARKPCDGQSQTLVQEMRRANGAS